MVSDGVEVECINALSFLVTFGVAGISYAEFRLWRPSGLLSRTVSVLGLVTLGVKGIRHSLVVGQRYPCRTAASVT